MYFHSFRRKLLPLVQTIRSAYNGRNLHTSKHLLSNYEGDGKTVVNILNKEQHEILLINAISELGFRLNNGVFVMGPIALFPRTVLMWNVNGLKDINPESLSLFCLLEPKLDILILGTGHKSIMPSKEVRLLLKSHNIALEVLTTEHAITTFNFLNCERRCIAAALMPPEVVRTHEEEMYLLLESESCNAFEVIEKGIRDVNHPKMRLMKKDGD